MKIIFTLLTGLILFSCNNSNDSHIVYNGRLESDIIRISAEVAGKIDTLSIREGEWVRKGQLLAVINSDKIQTRLQRQKIQLQEVQLGRLSLKAQLKELNAQLELNRKTLAKTQKMVSSGAATDQKKDELETQVEVLLAKKDALKIQETLLLNKKEQVSSTIRLTGLSLKDSRILAPLDGQVLNRFVNAGEFSAPGMALLEIADLSSLEASIYLPLNMLGQIKLGSEAEISIDGQENPLKGSVKWISSESEFTPKTILTEETRTTLVYRVKIEVPNPDGILKIGMPVDVVF